MVWTQLVHRNWSCPLWWGNSAAHGHGQLQVHNSRCTMRCLHRASHSMGKFPHSGGPCVHNTGSILEGIHEMPTQCEAGAALALYWKITHYDHFSPLFSSLITKSEQLLGGWKYSFYSYTFSSIHLQASFYLILLLVSQKWLVACKRNEFIWLQRRPAFPISRKNRLKPM